MKLWPPLKKQVLLLGSLALLVVVAILVVRHTRNDKIILEVINKHFTVGEKIPSVYLRVYADGTAESSRVIYGDEEDAGIPKKKVLPLEDFKIMQEVICQPELRSIDSEYNLVVPVIDSWMEWDVTIRQTGHEQEVKVRNFLPDAAASGKWNKPYPGALVTLGCTIWKLRNDVYGDEPQYSSSPTCKKAFAALTTSP